MTELLSREKELLKINTKLNEMASETLSSVVGKTQAYVTCTSRFDTFSKQKGQSTLLKKKGAGDEPSDGPSATAGRNATPKDRTFTRGKQSVAFTKKNTHQPSDGSKPRTPESQLVQPLAKVSNNTGKKIDPKGQSRSEGNAERACTYIKYRNPKFKESPSLELIIKEDHEQSELQLVKAEMLTDTESMKSIMTGTNSNKRVTADSYIKFLKAKIGILEDDHQRITEEMTQQRELLERTLGSQKRFEAQLDQAYSLNGQLSEQLRKVEEQYEDVSRRGKDRKMEIINQMKDFECMKRDLRQLKQTNACLENRLGRALEDLEAARSTMSKMRLDERELKETTRSELESKDKQIKGLKRQRADLLNAYKKQLFMIDNLKRQTVCMEQTTLLDINEKEFNKILEFNSTKETN